MAAQSLREAVKIGTKDLLADQEHLLSELRDFWSHEVMRYEVELMKSGVFTREEEEMVMGGVRTFFHRVFKDITCFLPDEK